MEAKQDLTFIWGKKVSSYSKYGPGIIGVYSLGLIRMHASSPHPSPAELESVF